VPAGLPERSFARPDSHLEPVPGALLRIAPRSVSFFVSLILPGLAAFSLIQHPAGAAGMTAATPAFPASRPSAMPAVFPVAFPSASPSAVSPALPSLLLAASSSSAATRTPARAGDSPESAKVQVEVLARGLDHPWALAFIDRQRMLVTERAGRLRLVGADGRVGAPIAGLPKIDAGGQGGLLDVVADGKFASSRRIYFCYAEAGPSGRSNSTALASARLSDDATRLEDLKVLFSQKPKIGSSAHFGCRIVEEPGTDNLFLTLGDRYSRKDDAQTLDNHHGKVVRIRKDGGIPADNPFVKRAGALPEIWSFGHRNIQGAAIGPDGRLWIHEHGPQGGDEINRPQAGGNYGWPLITYGENYGGGKIGDGATARAGLEQPVFYWTPSIAPSGMAFLRGAKYGGAWQDSLFIGSLKFQYLDRIELRNGRVHREEHLLEQRGQRIRDVREGPDGLLYLLTDESDGQLLRLKSLQ
jgi:glucose/arabinose dehydrogenase